MCVGLRRQQPGADDDPGDNGNGGDDREVHLDADVEMCADSTPKGTGEGAEAGVAVEPRSVDRVSGFEVAEVSSGSGSADG